jgi:AcrR family transcriptional regulator
VTKKTTGGNGRPNSLELLWGGRARTGPGPRPVLSLEKTVRGAIDMADADGLEGFTMGRLAARLGVTTMALYRYVPGKEELIDLMIDAARGTPPSADGLGWRAGLAQWARANRAVLLRHPWLLHSITSRVPIGPNWLAWVESALQVLSGAGFTAKETMAVVFLVDGHVRSSAQISLGVTGTGAWAEDFRRVLERVADDERYSALTALAAADGFDEGADDTADAFEFGLERLLDGIGAFVRTHGAARRGPKAIRRVGQPRTRKTR